MFTFEASQFFQFLWFLPLAIAPAWFSRAHYSKRLRITSAVLRAFLVVVVVCAIARPAWNTREITSVSPEVVFLNDTSSSIGENQVERQLLASSYADALSDESLLREIEFSGPSSLSGRTVDDNQGETNIENALDFAATQFSGNGTRHIVLFTDGQETRGNALSGATRMRGMGVQVHVVPVGKHRASSPRIVGVSPPAESRVAYTSYAFIHLLADQRTKIRLDVVDEDGIAVSGSDFDIGSERVIALPIHPKRKGLHRWKVLLRAKKGSSALGRQEDLWFQVDGPPELLLCDSEPLDLAPLKRILQRLQFTCRIAPLSAFPDTIESLSQYDAVLMSDLPGPDLSEIQVRALKQYVSGGGGLIFLGGSRVSAKQWRASKLEELLPIDFAPEVARVVQEIKSVHVCFLLDISGSMAEPLGVDRTGRPVSKLEMMKEAVRLSLNELPSSAIVSLVVFFGSAHVVLEAVPVAERRHVRQTVTNLSVGGGTNIVPGMRLALDLLRRSSVAKNLIILTDGVSSENPSEELCDEIRNADINLTSIAVGPESNKVMLQHVADRTHGQFFYCGDAATIPRVFVKEARAIKTLAVMPRMRFEPRLGPDHGLLGDLSSGSFPILEAAMPATAKPSALVAIPLLTDRDQPLLAIWSIGLGRVAAYMSDAKPIWARRWFRWDKLQRFWGRLLGSIIRRTSEYKTKVDLDTDGARCIIRVSIRDAEGRLPHDIKPGGVLRVETDQGTSNGTQIYWRQLPSGIFEGTALIRAGMKYMCDLEFQTSDGSSVYRNHYVLQGDRSLEMLRTGPDESRLREIAIAGGGLYNPTPSLLADHVGGTIEQPRSVTRPLWGWFIGLAILLWPVDIACRRFL